MADTRGPAPGVTIRNDSIGFGGTTHTAGTVRATAFVGFPGAGRLSGGPFTIDGGVPPLIAPPSAPAGPAGVLVR